jgi:hypothetical protein
MTRQWCVVVEHKDGSVGVTGPFLSADDAETDALATAMSVAGPYDDVVKQTGHDTLTFMVGDEDSGEEAWVYTQLMAAPGHWRAS